MDVQRTLQPATVRVTSWPPMLSFEGIAIMPYEMRIVIIIVVITVIIAV